MRESQISDVKYSLLFSLRSQTSRGSTRWTRKLKCLVYPMTFVYVFPNNSDNLLTLIYRFSGFYTQICEILSIFLIQSVSTLNECKWELRRLLVVTDRTDGEWGRGIKIESCCVDNNKGEYNYKDVNPQSWRLSSCSLYRKTPFIDSSIDLSKPSRT